jgi:hypothetical protein
LLTPQQNTEIESGLAIMILGMHRPLSSWMAGPNGVSIARKVCGLDQVPWECETVQWAMERIKLPRQPEEAPVSPAGCDALPYRLLQTAGNGHSKKGEGDDEPEPEETA